MENFFNKPLTINWEKKIIKERNLVSLIAKNFSIPISIANFFASKNLFSANKILEYLNPPLKGIHNPYLMLNMQKAVSKILKSIETNENILVYGDYDVDGTTSVAMLFCFLKELKANVNYYTPDRYTEGYGISQTAVNWAYKKKFSLIIALDCGTTDFVSIDLAQNLGLEIIICDHHTPQENLPKAYAILNPKQKNCSYPFKELSGCGIGFKLIQAMAIQLKLSQKKIINDCIELLAISIACDIVPLEGENRILLHYGLKKISQNPSLGVKSLLKISGILNNKISTTNLVFNLGPRINASGRMDNAKHSVEIFITKDKKEIKNKVLHLEDLNIKRKIIDEKTTLEALNMIKEQQEKDDKEKRTTVLFSENWHKGIIGIVASRCIEYYYKPTVILTKSSDNQAVGSARSIDGFNLYKALEYCSKYLNKFGGHNFAAGLSIDIKNIEKFKSKFENFCSNNKYDSLFAVKKYIDGFLSIKSIDHQILSLLSKIEPCGPENQKPIFYDDNVELINFSVIKNQHIKLFIKHSDGYIIEGFGFNLKHYQSELSSKKKIIVIYSIDSFSLDNCLSIRIEDLKFI